MSQQYFSWLVGVNVATSVLLSIALVAILWIGWMRTRRLAYLVLVVWALTMLGGFAMPLLLYSPAQQVTAKLFPGLTSGELMMWSNFVRSTVSSLLLLTGFALLIFRDERSKRSSA